nr:MAG TPA: hypothetical protein [Caudoviricetes sp.]
MNRIRELIYRCSSLNFISCCLKHFQISRKTCRFTTDIYHLFNPKINNLDECSNLVCKNLAHLLAKTIINKSYH